MDTCSRRWVRWRDKCHRSGRARASRACTWCRSPCPCSRRGTCICKDGRIAIVVEAVVVVVVVVELLQWWQNGNFELVAAAPSHTSQCDLRQLIATCSVVQRATSVWAKCVCWWMDMACASSSRSSSSSKSSWSSSALGWSLALYRLPPPSLSLSLPLSSSSSLSLSVSLRVCGRGNRLFGAGATQRAAAATIKQATLVWYHNVGSCLWVVAVVVAVLYYYFFSDFFLYEVSWLSLISVWA